MKEKGVAWMTLAAILVVASFFLSLATWFSIGYASGSLFSLLNTVSWIFYIVFVLSFIFWLWALIDSLKHRYVRTDDKFIWVVVIIFTWIVGAFLYYFLVRASHPQVPKKSYAHKTRRRAKPVKRRKKKYR